LAIAQYERVVKIEPNNALAFNNLANAYFRQNDARAIETAERAYKLAPTSAITADTLGWLLLQRSASPRAIELLRSAATQAPKNPELGYHYAVALVKAGDKAGARRKLEDLLADGHAFPQRADAEQLLKTL
jgi:tetratricopeptide (TPR) repeat protein